MRREVGTSSVSWLGGARRQCVLIACVAIVMGWPALRGGFVGVDDKNLVLNHVLVNHPSWSHAAELFTIVHRDLYQPVALLSFSAEFAIASALGWLDGGIEQIAWFFHLTNVLLHALTAVLVWVVIKTWSVVALGVSAHAKAPARAGAPPAGGDRPPLRGPSAPLIATVGALVFAAHPLQAEVVAWLNGRMMLLSTLFALVSVWALGRWVRDDRPRQPSGVEQSDGTGLASGTGQSTGVGRPARWHWAAITVVCVALSGLSKIRVGLPILLVLLPLVCGIRPGLRGRSAGAGDPVGAGDSAKLRGRIGGKLIGLWVAVFAITGVLAVVNLLATQRSGMFTDAEDVLHGPNLARVFLALATQITHVVWPIGLSPYYPAPETVRWTDPAVVRSVAIVGVCLLLWVWGAWRVWGARRGGIVLLAGAWFILCLGDTLPFVPQRNLLTADRYMYLPMVGVCWLLGVGYVRLLAFLESGAHGWRPAWSAAGVGVVGLLIAVSWHAVSFYETPIAKATRVASLFPETPGVWDRVGWGYYDQGRYDEAIEFARKELRRDDPRIQSRAHGLIGSCQMKLGQWEAGIASHREAVLLFPSDRAVNGLAMALDEAGRTAEAIPFLEQAFPADSPHNPGINRLADAYRRMNRVADARKQYERALANNPYDVSAALGLAELDLGEGTRDSLRAAEARLLRLLEWMPENVSARVNLAVARSRLGQDALAMEDYRQVLAYNPRQATALLNLAFLENRAGRVDVAVALFDRAAGVVESVEQADVIHGFYLAHGMADKAVALWAGFLRRYPDEPRGRVMQCWSLALAGDLESAERAADEVVAAGGREGDYTAIRVYVALRKGRFADAMNDVHKLFGADDDRRGARSRLLQALPFLDQDDAWTYCIAAWVLVADRRGPEARMALGICTERCPTKSCRDTVLELREALGRLPDSVDQPGVGAGGGDSGG